MLVLLWTSFCFALFAVTWAVVLVDDGMLLQPVQRWLRLHVPDLDSRWWWKPLWGCYRCVAGQVALWGTPVLWYYAGAGYSLFAHLVTICATILFACILNKIYQWTTI